MLRLSFPSNFCKNYFVVFRDLISSIFFVSLACTHFHENQLFAEDDITVSPISNGMELIMIPSNKVPLVTILLAVKAGASTETKDINGLTHLWEHMFFKGNARYPDQEAFKRRIRELGIIYNGDTSAEMVRYYFTLPSGFLDQGIQFMADAIATPKLEDKELERERKVVLDEYDRNASRPGFELYKLQQKIIYGEKFYNRDPLGIRKVIENATKDQLVRIKNEVFVPKNSALLISGDLEPIKTKALVEKHFSSWKTPDSWITPSNNQFQKFPANTELIMTKELVSVPSLQIEFEGPKARENPKDTFPADVLSSLLAQPSGKFYKNFIDTGKVLSSNFGYYTQSQAGEISLSFSCKADKLQQVKKEIFSEIKKWKEANYFSEAELENIRRSLSISKKREKNSPSEYVKNLAFWWTITGIPYYNRYHDELKKITLKDIRDFVTKYLIDKPYVLTLLLSPEDAKTANIEENTSKYRENLLKDL